MSLVGTRPPTVDEWDSDEIWNIKVSQFQNPIFYGGVDQKCSDYFS